MYPDMPCASNVPFDVLNACVGHGYPAGEDELAITTVLFLLDHPTRRQEACLSTCRQLRSLFAERLSVLSVEAWSGGAVGLVALAIVSERRADLKISRAPYGRLAG
jgi:hypothetical protein